MRSAAAGVRAAAQRARHVARARGLHGGRGIGPDLFVFYRSLGINLKQLYGSTETSVMVCVQPNGEVKPDTVGPPMKGVEVRVLDSGEIVLRCPGFSARTTRTRRRRARPRTPRAGSTPAMPATSMPAGT
jgi:acyl-coenzyme A synthetase/AMP-(fatty) acid ligase